MLPLMIQHHPNRARTHLRGKFVRSLRLHGSTFSRVGASGNPGAVHSRDAGIFIPRTIYTAVGIGLFPLAIAAGSFRIDPANAHAPSPNPAEARCLDTR